MNHPDDAAVLKDTVSLTKKNKYAYEVNTRAHSWALSFACTYIYYIWPRQATVKQNERLLSNRYQIQDYKLVLWINLFIC